MQHVEMMVRVRCDASYLSRRKNHVIGPVFHEERLDLRAIAEVEFRTRTKNEIAIPLRTEFSYDCRTDQSTVSGNENFRILIHMSGLDDFHRRERKDEVSARSEICGFPFEDALAEMPRKHEEIIRLHRVRVGFRNDRNASARSLATKFVFVHFGYARQHVLGDSAVLEGYVSLRRRTVAENLLSFFLRFGEKREEVALVDFDILPEFRKYLSGSISVFVFMTEKRGNLFFVCGPVDVFRNNDLEASAVNVVKHDVDDFHSRAVDQPFDLPQCVVFEMLVANGVVRNHIYHSRHVALFEYPNSIVSQGFPNLGHEIGRIRKIVEHRNGRNDFRVLLRTSANGLERKEIRFVLNVRRIVLGEFLRGRVNAEKFVSVVTISGQKGSVVSGDVYDEVASLKINEGFRAVGNGSKVLDHPLVQSGAVSVIIAVKRFHIVIMGKLEKSAAILAGTFYEFERTCLHVFPGHGKHSGKRLASEVENGNEVGILTNAAFRDFGVEHRL